MEGGLACEELKTQCTCKGKMGYVPSVPNFLCPNFPYFPAAWKMASKIEKTTGQ